MNQRGGDNWYTTLWHGSPKTWFGTDYGCSCGQSKWHAGSDTVFSSWQKETNIPICRQLCLSDFTCLSAYLEPTQNNDRLWKFFHVLPICTFVAYLMHWRFQVCSKSTSSNCTPKLPFYYREFMMIIHWILGDDITLLNLLTKELR